ncbi:MAG: ABC transporter permease [Candidatus Dormibacteria bacterium]|jgi:ABC-2 type transport system permease protein
MASLDAGALILPPGGVERGIGRWGRDYVSMVRWHLASLRMWLMTILVVQVLSGVGFVLGISLFFRHIPESVALFVVTGVPVINLLDVGLLLGPQLVANQRTAGSYEYMQTLPISRSVSAAAWYTVCLLCGLPAMVVSLVVGQLVYDLPLHISLMIVPAVLLTSFAGTMLGYALAHAITKPMVTLLITQMLIFIIFGFAPILFPLQRMPAWLADVNWWFPFRHMAVVMRAALTSSGGPPVPTAYAVIGVWTVVCAALAGWTLGRRP